MITDVEGAIRKLKALKRFTGAKGSTAVTIERAIQTMQRVVDYLYEEKSR